VSRPSIQVRTELGFGFHSPIIAREQPLRAPGSARSVDSAIARTLALMTAGLV
jgi:hypothetical protein